MAQPQDHYEVLQVHRTAHPDVIQAAYRRLALLYHPDRNPSNEATAMMARLNEAYEVLSDPKRRAKYDREQELPREYASPDKREPSDVASAAPGADRRSRGRARGFGGANAGGAAKSAATAIKWQIDFFGRYVSAIAGAAALVLSGWIIFDAGGAWRFSRSLHRGRLLLVVVPGFGGSLRCLEGPSDGFHLGPVPRPGAPRWGGSRSAACRRRSGDILGRPTTTACHSGSGRQRTHPEAREILRMADQSHRRGVDGLGTLAGRVGIHPPGDRHPSRRSRTGGSPRRVRGLAILRGTAVRGWAVAEEIFSCAAVRRRGPPPWVTSRAPSLRPLPRWRPSRNSRRRLPDLA